MPNETPNTAPATVGNNNSNSNTGASGSNASNNNSGNDYNRRSRGGSRQQHNVQLTNPKNYEGSIPEVGGILAFKHEKLDNKLQFQVFMEKMDTYVLSNFKDISDIVPLFTKIVDPKPAFIKKRRPVALRMRFLQSKDQVVCSQRYYHH